MRSFRTLAVATTLALTIAGTALLTDRAASAAEDPAAVTVTMTDERTTLTRVAMHFPGHTYGDEVGYFVNVSASTGTVRGGTLTVLKQYVGSNTWTPIATGAGSSLLFHDPNTESALYKAVYSGYTATDSSEQSFQPAESDPEAITVTRGAKYIPKSAKQACLQIGPLSAPFSRKQVKVSYAKGMSPAKPTWKHAYTYETNRHGRYCFKVKKYQKLTQRPKRVTRVKTVFAASGGLPKQSWVQYFG